MMRRAVQFAVLGLAVLASTVYAQPQDKVSVRYLPGYPLPGRSLEVLDLRVERTGPFGAAEAQEIDRFFASVERILSEHRVAQDWQLAIPDAPYIEIAVELRDRRVRLVSGHVPLERSGSHVVTSRGLEALDGRSRDAVLAQQGEELRRHRAAFERLLALTLGHMRTRLSP